MSRFEAAMPVILAHEGGYANDPADPGGETKYGISLRFLSNEGIDLDGDGEIDGADIRGLTVTAAMALYREHFWDRHGYDRIVDTQVATKVFDLCVNMGPGRAHRLVQRALNACGHRLDEDGNLGPLTVQAINQASPRDLLLELACVAGAYYRTLAEMKPPLARFLGGWLRRSRWPFGEGESMDKGIA